MDIGTGLEVSPEVLAAATEANIANYSPGSLDAYTADPITDGSSGSFDTATAEGITTTAVNQVIALGTVPPNAQLVGAVDTPQGTVMQYTSPGQPGVYHRDPAWWSRS